jgi:hypothetical protein
VTSCTRLRHCLAGSPRATNGHPEYFSALSQRDARRRGAGFPPYTPSGGPGGVSPLGSVRLGEPRGGAGEGGRRG